MINLARRLCDYIASSLYRKVLVSIVAVVGLSLAIYTVVYTRATSQEIIDNCLYEASAQMESTEKQIRKNVELLEVATQILNTNTQLIEAAHDLDGQSAGALWELKTRTLKTLSNVSDVVPGLCFLRIYSAGSNALELWPTVYSMERLRDTEPGGYLSEGNDVMWQIGRDDHARGEQDPNTVYISRFSNVHFGSRNGVCVIETGMTAGDFFGENYMGASSEQVCFVQAGTTFFHDAQNPGAAALIEEYPDLYAMLQAGKDESQAGFVLDTSAGYVVSAAYNEVLDIHLYNVVSTRRIGSIVSNARRTSILFTLGIALLLTTIILLLVRFFLRRVSTLKTYMLRVQDEGAAPGATGLGKDEVGQLAGVFDNTVRAVLSLTQIYLEDAEKLHQSEVRLLQSQINWHFIYNTLNAIEMHAVVRGDEDTADAVSTFGSLLRYTAGDGRVLVPFSSELRYIEDYAALVNMQHDDCLELEIEVPAELMKMGIPRMMLQPIIENALNHAFLSAGKRGRVCVSARRMDDALLLFVWDNGAGIPPERLAALNAHIMQAGEAGRAGAITIDSGESHIALPNINRRLKAHFGAAYGLWLESDGAAYTKVCLRLGLQPVCEDNADV